MFIIKALPHIECHSVPPAVCADQGEVDRVPRRVVVFRRRQVHQANIHEGRVGRVDEVGQVYCVVFEW